MYYDVQKGIRFDDGSEYAFSRFLEAQENGDYHKWELMQFTGLLDSKGNEIYEGDILANPDGYKGKASIVKWNDEGAYFHVFRGETSSGYTLKGETSRAEIIGNIYENPELLKV